MSEHKGMNMGVAEFSRQLSRNDQTDIVAYGREVIETEAEALSSLVDALDENFARAVTILLNVTGRVVTTGIGKSGYIARKFSATLASTGTPSLYVHPVEAAHGDLGMLMAGDALLAFSN